MRVPLLNFEGGPGVPLLNFRGVSGATFKLLRGSRVPSPGVLVPLLHHAPLLESLFKSEYCEIFKSTYFEQHLRTLLLKMCSWNWEKMKIVHKEYKVNIKETSENVCFYFMKATSENACFYFMIGFLWSLYSDTIFLWCGEK